MIEPQVEINENDETEEEFNCKLCDQSFWYQGELNDHLKSKHGIADPIKHEKEEKQKRLALLQKQKQQQQQALSTLKRPGQPGTVLKKPPPKPSMHTRSLASSILQNRGNDMLRRFGDRSSTLGGLNGLRARLMSGRIPPRSGNQGKLRTKGTAGFQFKDGAFICINCGKDFNDGNLMVKHQYCKKDSAKIKKNAKKREAALRAAEKKEKKKRGRGRERRSKRTRTRRASDASSIESDSDEIVEASDAEDETASDKEIVIDNGPKEKKKGYWNGYKLWSTRKRKEINRENPDYTFAEVSKMLSEGWKEITEDETRRLKEEADDLNENNIRKLPEEKQGTGLSEESENSEEEDPSFDETNLKKAVTKQLPPVRRSGRTRKNPAFFQEVAEKEEKFDELLDYNEEKQIKESLDENGNPKKKSKSVPKKEDPDAGPSSSTRRRYRKKMEPKEEKQEVELETTRSGRVRKKARFNDHLAKYSDHDQDSDNSQDDDFEVKQEEEEKVGEESSSEEKSEDEEDNDSKEDGSDIEDRPLRKLKTPKRKATKRGRPSKKKKSSKDDESYQVPRSAKNSRGKRGKYNKKNSKKSVIGQYIGHQMESDAEDDRNANDDQDESEDDRRYSKRTSDVAEESEEEVETELDKEAQLHGLSDGKEAAAAWDLPIE